MIAAGDGQEAVQLLRAEGARVDLVLTDLKMPRLGGRALFDQARREGLMMPFLFASGYVDSGRKPEPIDETLPFIRKPWAMDDLLARVRDLLDAHRASPVPVAPSRPA